LPYFSAGRFPGFVDAFGCRRFKPGQQGPDGFGVWSRRCRGDRPVAPTGVFLTAFFIKTAFLLNKQNGQNISAITIPMNKTDLFHKRNQPGLLAPSKVL